MAEIIEMEIKRKGDINLNIERSSNGTNNYNPLTNKPQINGIVLIGNKTGKDLKLQDEMDALSVQEIERILYLN